MNGTFTSTFGITMHSKSNYQSTPHSIVRSMLHLNLSRIGNRRYNWTYTRSDNWLSGRFHKRIHNCLSNRWYNRSYNSSCTGVHNRTYNWYHNRLDRRPYNRYSNPICNRFHIRFSIRCYNLLDDRIINGSVIQFHDDRFHNWNGYRNTHLIIYLNQQSVW